MSGIEHLNRAEPGSNGADGRRENVKLWRWLKIVTLLQGNPGLTSRHLAERCEVGRRTIFRDIGDLNGAGIPIHYEKGYKFTGDFLMRPVQLKVDEAVALTVAATALASHGGPHHREAAQAALDKVKAVLPRALASLTADAASRIRIDLGAFEPSDAASDLLGNIEDAVLDQKRCDLTYYSRNQGKVTQRKVDPYALLFRERAWYLVAYCHERKDVMLFRVDRIREMTPLDEDFDMPKGFSLEDYMADAWEVERGEPVTVTIRFNADAAPLIREARWHPSQVLEEQPDGSLLMKVTTGGRHALLRWVLGFAGRAVVVEPEEMRAELVRMAEAAAGANGGPVGQA